jgi:CheY-like chemotaxis protein
LFFIFLNFHNNGLHPKLQEKTKMTNGNNKLDVLVVDDNFDNLTAAEQHFADHNLRTAHTYAAAIRQIREGGRLDAVLTDLMLPLGDGPSQDRFDPAPLGYAIALYAARAPHCVPLIGMLTNLNHHENAVSATFDDFYSWPRKVSEAPIELALAEMEYRGELERGRTVFRINNSYFVAFDEWMTPKGCLGPDGKLIKVRGGEAPPGCTKVKNFRYVLDLLLTLPKK